MRWKLTCGITFASTSAMIFCTSPAWIALSALMVSITSVETCLISASGAWRRRRAPAADASSEQRPGRQAMRYVATTSCSFRMRRLAARSFGRAARRVCVQRHRDAQRVELHAAGRGAYAVAWPLPAAAAAVPQAARLPSRRRFGGVACRRRCFRRVAVVDQAAAALQVGVAHEAVLVERDVVEHLARAEQVGARVDRSAAP